MRRELLPPKTAAATIHSGRLTPVCMALCGMFSGSVGATSALPVTSCADDGSPGTLRRQVSASLDGEEIDLHSQLPLGCSTITLSQSELTFPHRVKMIGPTDRTLTILPGLAYSQGVIVSDTYLDIENLTIRGGRRSLPSRVHPSVVDVFTAPENSAWTTSILTIASRKIPRATSRAARFSLWAHCS